MNLTVVVKEPVYQFARRLPPEHRRMVKLALKGLRREQGDIRALEQNLSGYYRLRIGKYRLIFRYADAKSIEAISSRSEAWSTRCLSLNSWPN